LFGKYGGFFSFGDFFLAAGGDGKTGEGTFAKTTRMTKVK
jgi:hypothetical protein